MLAMKIFYSFLPLSMSMFLTSMFLFMKNKILIISWSLPMFYSSPINFPIILDPEGTLFSAVVLLISSSIFLFSVSYMASETFKNRFTWILFLFVVSMNLLIMFPNLITLLIGWDGLGIVSFLLVIYYQNNKSLAAGMITALTNRIGDVLILLSIAMVLLSNQWNALTIDNSLPMITAMMLMFAAMTKSAQVPFSSWLPAAMAAPTPVSALVHSSTLVTAGVFLLYRFHPFLYSFPSFCKILLIMSSITMFMAGTVALAEQDLKKIVALSTLSQLGVMMASLALKIPNFTLFHLITHALFKALLFVCAGSTINFFGHTQDLRQVGNTAKQMPIMSMATLCSLTALCGFPFMAGFYSKDFIIEFNMMTINNMSIIILFMLATILTVFYSIRFLFFVQSIHQLHLPNSYHMDTDKYLIIPMLILSMGALFGGSILNWTVLTPIPEIPISLISKIMPLMIIIITPLLFLTKENTLKPQPFLASMWFLTPMSSQLILKKPLNYALMMNSIVDQGWTETLGPQGIASLNINSASNLEKFNKLFFTSIPLLIMTSTLMILILF
uniref:NADH-ubiquinone oxidoreductase chain 5 n=1 Tax=Dinophilus gyrociliatus TaxID=120995 RepID=A0A343TAR6_9ANNE|nr:NADH dehydrogenase subunit 5 [Dinophilus gyrociliatus]